MNFTGHVIIICIVIRVAAARYSRKRTWKIAAFGDISFRRNNNGRKSRIIIPVLQGFNLLLSYLVCSPSLEIINTQDLVLREWY